MARKDYIEREKISKEIDALKFKLDYLSDREKSIKIRKHLDKLMFKYTVLNVKMKGETQDVLHKMAK